MPHNRLHRVVERLRERRENRQDEERTSRLRQAREALAERVRPATEHVRETAQGARQVGGELRRQPEARAVQRTGGAARSGSRAVAQQTRELVSEGRDVAASIEAAGVMRPISWASSARAAAEAGEAIQDLEGDMDQGRLDQSTARQTGGRQQATDEPQSIDERLGIGSGDLDIDLDDIE